MVDVSVGQWRVTYDRNVRHSFYIGGYVITNTDTGEKRATVKDPCVSMRYHDLIQHLNSLFLSGNAILD